MSRYLVPGLWILAAGGTALVAVAAPDPTPTPTPRPKLSGGFGRPRATPVATAAASGVEGGQSLADVVRAAQGSRETTAGAGAPEKSGITIDNKTLVKDTAKGRITTSSVAAPKPPGPAPTAAPHAAAAGAANGSAPDAPAASSSGEAEWRETARKERKQVEDAKTRVAELNATSKKLENDFYAWDDGQYRDRVIKPAWDRARQELEQAKLDLEAAEKQLADLPERARKAGAMPGWIRE